MFGLGCLDAGLQTQYTFLIHEAIGILDRFLRILFNIINSM